MSGCDRILFLDRTEKVNFLPPRKPPRQKTFTREFFVHVSSKQHCPIESFISVGINLVNVPSCVFTMQINEVASVKLLKHVYVVSSLAFMSTNRLKISGAAYYYAVCYIHYIYFFQVVERNAQPEMSLLQYLRNYCIL